MVGIGKVFSVFPLLMVLYRKEFSYRLGKKKNQVITVEAIGREPVSSACLLGARPSLCITPLHPSQETVSQSPFIEVQRDQATRSRMHSMPSEEWGLDPSQPAPKLRELFCELG